jgi:hypothetical protein
MNNNTRRRTRLHRKHIKDTTGAYPQHIKSKPGHKAKVARPKAPKGYRPVAKPEPEESSTP